MEIGKINVILSFIALFSIPFSSFGGPLEEGSAAIQQHDYKKAFSLLLPIAKEGNAFAQYNVGVMYAQGLGVEKNEKKATQWYQKAANQGDSDAQSNLALMYEAGRGLEKDYQKAMEWYLKAASQGNAMAQQNIGSLYFNGYGVKKDDKKAFEWYSKAASQGLPFAENSLGGMYVKGWGVEKDVNKGLEWIMKAAEQGLSIARENAFNIYYHDAKQGNPEAMHNVATMCLQGWAGEQNPLDCFFWYEEAAKRGIDASRNSLAKGYENGLFGIPVDKQKAQYWKSQIGKKAEQ